MNKTEQPIEVDEFNFANEKPNDTDINTDGLIYSTSMMQGGSTKMQRIYKWYFLPICLLFCSAVINITSNTASAEPFPLPISSVTASTHDGNIPENTFDNDLSTRWSAEGDGQWIAYDLGSENVISHLLIAFYDTQVTTIDIQLSHDNNLWNTVFSGNNSGLTLEQEQFTFQETTARYVRIVGHGNTDNAWNSITELDIVGSSQSSGIPSPMGFAIEIPDPAPPISGDLPTTTSISQNGITWTFSEPVEYSQFVNGDYYVIDPGSGVTINSISPGSLSDSSIRNGSMINPLPNYNIGFDNGVPYMAYSNALNVALDVTANNPLVVEAGSSLISSISANRTCGPDNGTYMANMAVLTVLSSPPSAGSFRPPYSGSNKPIHNIDEINYNILQSLVPAPGAPSLSELEAQFENVWYDNNISWAMRSLHPCNNMPDYGADMARQTSLALLSLHLNYSNAQKEKLLLSMLQYAIDLSAIVANGGAFPANGGQGLGRKSVLALGAMVLNDTTMKTQLNAANEFVFGEDQHTFYVQTTDWYPSRTVLGYDRVYTAEEQYNSSNHPVGTPEWGRNHGHDVSFDDSRLAAMYRDYYGRQLGGLLSALMLGAESTWNWSAAFDYIERVKDEMEQPCALGGPCYYNATTWELDMYDLYWGSYK